jgi:hypothetical protein
MSNLNHSYYQMILNLMENQHFRKFFDYDHESPEYKAIIMFMKLYISIEKVGNNSLTPNQKINILHNIITNRNKRKHICDKFISSKLMIDNEYGL